MDGWTQRPTEFPKFNSKLTHLPGFDDVSPVFGASVVFSVSAGSSDVDVLVQNMHCIV